MEHVKIAFSLPRDLFDAFERARRRRGVTRSAAIRGGLRAWLGRQSEEDKVRRWIAAYQRVPETEQELATTEALSGYAFGESSGFEGDASAAAEPARAYGAEVSPVHDQLARRIERIERHIGLRPGAGPARPARPPARVR